MHARSAQIACALSYALLQPPPAGAVLLCHTGLNGVLSPTGYALYVGSQHVHATTPKFQLHNVIFICEGRAVAPLRKTWCVTVDALHSQCVGWFATTKKAANRERSQARMPHVAQGQKSKT